MSKFTWYDRNLERTLENLDYFLLFACVIFYLSVCLTLPLCSQSAVSSVTDLKSYTSFQVFFKANLRRDL